MIKSSIFQLEDLSVRVDGLASMTQALRDCFSDGPNTPETYTDAVDLLSALMFELKNDFNTALQNLRAGN